MSFARSAVRYETARTSFGMLAQLVLRIALAAAGLWALSTLALVWYWTGHYCGPLAHRYFGRWILAWFLTEQLPIPFASLPYRGRHYPVESMYQFLNEKIYSASFGAWFHYYELWGLVPILALASLFVLAYFMGGGDGSDGEHLRGLSLVPQRRLNRALRGAGIMLAGVCLPRALESEHFLISGATGSGKSVEIRSILRQVEQRGETAVVVDPECEFTAEFYRPERGDVVLNPLDARCPAWSPWDELAPENYEVDAELLATAFLPDPATLRGEDGAAFFFRQSSRTLITSLLKVAEPKVAASLPALLNLPRAELKRRLSGTAAEALIDPGAHDQGAGIVATATNAINPLRYLPEQAEYGWSAREWATTRRGWVFLTSRDDIAAAVMPLLSLWLDCIVRRLLAGTTGGGRSRRVWIVVDELSALKRQAQLESLVVRGRKRDLAAVIGFQTISQLRAIYGRDQAGVLASMPSTKLLLRVDEPETAQFLSRQIGEREASREQLGSSAGDGRTAFSLHPSRVIEPLVLASEIQGLQKLAGYLCIAGYDRARVKVPLCVARTRVPGFIPRRAHFQDEQPQKGSATPRHGAEAPAEAAKRTLTFREQS